MTLNRRTVFSMLSFCMFVSACSPFSGTGTGNPNSAQSLPVTFATSMAEISCSTINKCHGIELKSCHATLIALTTFASKVGLNEPLSLGEISARESMGLLVAESETANACLSKLQLLDCGSGEVVASPLDAAAMLDPICADVFATSSGRDLRRR